MAGAITSFQLRSMHLRTCDVPTSACEVFACPVFEPFRVHYTLTQKAATKAPNSTKRCPSSPPQNGARRADNGASAEYASGDGGGSDDRIVVAKMQVKVLIWQAPGRQGLKIDQGLKIRPCNARLRRRAAA